MFFLLFCNLPRSVGKILQDGTPKTLGFFLSAQPNVAKVAVILVGAARKVAASPATGFVFGNWTIGAAGPGNEGIYGCFQK